MIDDFPKQKISSGAKNLPWAKKCIDKAIHLNSLEHPKIRQSYSNKIVNYNLANDILDKRDVEQTTNPFRIKGMTFPAQMRNYNIVMPKIDLLVGEEAKRPFDWKLISLNRDAVTEKDKNKKQKIREFVQQKVKAGEEQTEMEIKEELQDLVDYLAYDFQDLREKRGTAILKYYADRQNFQKKFNEGFLDALIGGESNYCVDIEAGEPVLRKVNPLNVRAYRTGESPWLQDADIVVEEGYYSPAKVIDKYNDTLKPSDIDTIESRRFTFNENTKLTIQPDSELRILPDGAIVPASQKGAVFDLGDGIHIDPTLSSNASSLRSAYDTYGNILVTRVVWASYRKIGILKYFSEETGNEEMDIVDEKFKVREDLGQEVEWRWVKEWWEGTKIGAGSNAIFTKIQRRPSFRKSGNPSLCHSGYVGLAFNINTSKAMSLMDRMKPYQYLYNILMYRTELAIAKSHGKIMRLPLHEIPTGWTMDKYLAYAFGFNIAVYDAFKEGKKGAAMGKIAGQMQQNNQTIDMEMSAYIQQHIDMMSFIKAELGEISGVSQARQGQIHNRSAVGNVEREVTQSSHITEKWFLAHDLIKKEVMQVFLDVAIHALKDNPIKAQIVQGDMLTEIFEAMPDDFSQAELGLVISNNSKEYELLQTLKSISQELVKQQQITFGELTKIYTSDSIADMTRRIENAQKRRDEQEQEMAKQQNETQERIAQQTIQWEQEKHYSELDMDKYKIDMEAALEQAKLMKEENNGQDPINTFVSLEQLRQNQEKIDNDFQFRNRDLNLKEKKINDDKQKSKQELAIKRKQANKPTASASK